MMSFGKPHGRGGALVCTALAALLCLASCGDGLLTTTTMAVTPMTFDYRTIAQYKTGPLSLAPGSMPQDLKDKLNDCLYRGTDAGPWYGDAPEAERSAAAVQDFLASLGDYINAAGGNDAYQKVRMANDWVVDYMSYAYDYACDNYGGNDRWDSQSAADILRRGMNFSDALHGSGICSGYAYLFEAVMEKIIPDESGITWQYKVMGWAGAPDYGKPARNASTNGVPTNHMWNQVEIYGVKFNVDACWNDAQSSATQVHNYAFFLPNPLDFVWNYPALQRHIPKYFGEQLIDSDGAAPWDDAVVTWDEFHDAYWGDYRLLQQSGTNLGF